MSEIPRGWCGLSDGRMVDAVTRSAYDVLGLAPEASHAEVRRAYRRLAKEAHPDLHGGAADAHRRWLEIQLAYELLSNPDRRLSLDRGGDDPFGALSTPEMLRQRLAQLTRRKNRLRRLYE